MHRLLQSQLRRVMGLRGPDELDALLTELEALGTGADLSAGAARVLQGLRPLLARVGQSYEQADRDLDLRARSLQLSSQELVEANQRLREEGEAQARAIRSLKDTANTLLGGQGNSLLGEDATSLERLSRLMAEMVDEFTQARRELEYQKFALDQHAIVSVTDVDGIIVYANDKFCEISEYSREELIGSNHRIVNSGVHDPGVFRDLWKTIWKGKVWHGEICNRAKSGHRYWVAATVVPLLDGNGRPTQFIAIRTDITLQKALETELLGRRRFLQSITDAMGEGVFSMDAAGRCTFLNPEAERLLGWSQKELEGRCFHDAVHHSDWQGRAVPREDCPVLHHIQAGEIFRSDDDCFIRRDGSRFPISIVSVPLREDDRIVGSVSVFRDVTDQKRAQEELASAKEVADRANRLKSDFLANMSHEIRTPMNAVMGLTHLMMRTELSPRQRDYLEKIESSSRNLLGIINDILDFSKIEAGKLLIERIPLSLTGIIQEVTAVIQPKAREKGLELGIDLAADLPVTVIGDPLRIGQVLLNLASNAVKFTERGSVVVSVRGQPRPDGTCLLEFQVQDTGIGMTRQQMSRLFQPFTQADSSTTRQFGGTGLGLAICQQLSELMGGEIGVDSTPGVGSTFRFRVPCPVVEAAVAPIRLPAGLVGQRALVVDDCAAVRSILADMLDQFGLEVELAEGGWAALERLDAAVAGTAEPVGLVVLDWRMPDLDGAETLRRINGLSEPLPRVIMTTAYGADDMRQALGDQPVSGILEKPVTPSTMFDALMHAFEGGGQAPAGARPANAEWNGEVPGLAGRRVLLVEDNAINQQVACGLLDLAGVEITLASSGEEALDQLRRQSFDAVLMDIQMPGLDGYQTTGIIRRDLGLTSLPIIAMTAHAMAGDRERCLAAGMNDHVAKPISPPLLYGVLRNWAGEAPAATPCAAADGPPQPRRRSHPGRGAGAGEHLTQPFPDALPGLDLAAAKRNVNGNLTLLRRILLDFANRHADAADQLRDGVTGGRWDQVNRIAHTLKGTAATIGALHLSRLASELEVAAARNGEGLRADLLDGLGHALDEVTVGVQVLAQPTPPSPCAAAEPSAAPPDPRTRAEALDQAARLLDLLRNGDPEAGERAAGFARLLAATPAAAAAAAVAHHADSYDFEEAAGALDRVKQMLDRWSAP